MDIYAQNIIDHYKHPRNFGVLPQADFKQQELNASCGDDITVFLKFAGNKLKTLNFTGQGCAISQAGISILSEELIGQTKKQILAYNFEDIKNIFGVEISARRYNCAMLGLRAIQKAIGDSTGSK